jgi:hypothetical protein
MIRAREITYSGILSNFKFQKGFKKGIYGASYLASANPFVRGSPHGTATCTASNGYMV